MRAQTLLLLCFLSAAAPAEECACPPDETRQEKPFIPNGLYDEVPEYKIGERQILQEYRIYRSYLDENSALLDSFFKGWADTNPPISNQQLSRLPEAFRHAYAIFKDFYQPANLGRIGNPEWGTEQFAGVKYYVVQNSIDIAVHRELPKNSYSTDPDNLIFEASLKHFRPQIQGDKVPLILNDAYKSQLLRFLGGESYPAGQGNIMAPAMAKGESNKRMKFLNQFLKIYHGHWGGWRLITDPTISRINFNGTFTRAIVYFELVYQGGEATYQFKDGKWFLKESRLTWIT